MVVVIETAWAVQIAVKFPPQGQGAPYGPTLSNQWLGKKFPTTAVSLKRFTSTMIPKCSKIK